MAKTPINNDYANQLQKQISSLATRIVQKRQMQKASFEPEVYELRLTPVSVVENQNYNLVDTEASYSLIGQNDPADSGYAAEMYNNNSKADKTSTVVEGLVFKNNREFDFKV